METHDLEIAVSPQSEVIAKALRTWIESRYPDNTPSVSIRIRHFVKIEFDPAIPYDHYARLHQILSTYCQNTCKQENVLVIPWEDLIDRLWQAVQPEVVTAPLPVAPSPIVAPVASAPNLAAHLTRLKQRYQIDHRDLQTIALLGDPQPIAEAFVRLTLIKNEEHKDKERTLRAGGDGEAEQAFHDGRLRSWEDLYTAKTPIELNAIFDPDPKAQRPEPAPHRLLVLGRACIGKTTLLKYLSYQWATDSLFAGKFDAVFYIPFRKLDPARYAAPREYRVVDIINAECFNGDLIQAECDALHITIRDNPHRFLFLLDGYDEKLNTRGTSLERVFEQLVAQRCCLISSRPYDIENLKSIDRRLEVMGFTPADIEAYIHRFFTSPQQRLTPEAAQAKAKALIDYLKRNPNIWAIAHIPSITEMICVLHEDIMMHVQLTVSKLYHAFIRNLFQNLLMREGHSRAACTPAHIKEQTHLTQQCLEHIALQGMLEGQIILSEAMMDTAVQAVMPSTEEASARQAQREHLQLCGFLRRMNDRAEYYFIHLTFQEFFAASTIARRLKQTCTLTAVSENYEHMRQLILMHRYNPRFQLVWQFVAGLLSDDIKTLKRFFKILRTEPQDLLGNYSRQLLVNCLAECKEPKVLQLNRHQVLNPLLVALRDKDSDVRKAAAEALGNLGAATATEEVLMALACALGNEHWDVRRAAADALGMLGAAAATEKVLMALACALRDKDLEVRSSAADALRNLGIAVATEEVLATLVSMLRDEDWYVRYAAADALEKLGAATATEEVLIALLNALRDEDENVSKAAADALGNLGAAAATEEVLIALVSALQDKNSNVKYVAACALGNLGAVAATEKVLTALVNALRDEDRHVRRAAADALGMLGAAAATKEVLTALVGMLRDEDWLVREAAYDALGDMGAAAATEEVLIALVSVLKDEDERGYVREAAAYALGNLGAVADTEKVLTALIISALRDEERSVREAAAYALGKLGVAAATEKVLTALVGMLRDEDSDVRSAAAHALGNLCTTTATEKVLTALVGMLRDENRDIRSAAAVALGKLGATAATEEVLTTLVGMLRDENRDIRSAAAVALGKLGAAAATEEVLTTLVNALRDENEYVRYTTADALGNLGAAAATEEVLIALVSALQDEDSGVRSTAAHALGKLGAAAATEEVLIALVSILRDGNWHVRKTAADALEKLGAAAATEEVLVALVSALRDEHSDVRYAAAYALKKIGIAHDMATFFHLLPQGVAGAENVYTTVAAVLVYRFVKHQSPLFYDLFPTSTTLCCWEKGKLQRLDLPRASRQFFVQQIQKIWQEQTHLPIAAIPPLEFTRLHDAAAKGNIDELKHLLAESLVDLDNQHNDKKFTPLMCALENAQWEAADILLEAGASIHLVSCVRRKPPDQEEKISAEESDQPSFDNIHLTTAVTLAAGYEDPDVRYIWLQTLLSRRQRVTLDEFEHWLNARLSMHYSATAEEETADQNLLNTEVGQLTAMGNMIELFSSTSAHRYRAHQENILQAIVGLFNMKNWEKQIDYREYLQRIEPDIFLSIRIRLHVALLLKIIHAEIPEAILPNDKFALLAWLKSECLLILETLYVYQESALIKHLYNIGKLNKVEYESLLNAMARNIAQKISTLQEGEWYEFMTGFTVHAVYILFTRNENNLVAQLHNQDDKGVKLHHVRDNTYPSRLYPYFRGEWQQDGTPTPEFITKIEDLVTTIQDLLRAAFLDQTEAIHLLYPEKLNDSSIQQKQIEKRGWSHWPEQRIENCVAWNHNVSIFHRLLHHHRNLDNAQILYGWFIKQEMELIAPYCIDEGWGMVLISNISNKFVPSIGANHRRVKGETKNALAENPDFLTTVSMIAGKPFIPTQSSVLTTQTVTATIEMTLAIDAKKEDHSAIRVQTLIIQLEEKRQAYQRALLLLTGKDSNLPFMLWKLRKEIYALEYELWVCLEKDDEEKHSTHQKDSVSAEVKTLPIMVGKEERSFVVNKADGDGWCALYAAGVVANGDKGNAQVALMRLIQEIEQGNPAITRYVGESLEHNARANALTGGDETWSAIRHEVTRLLQAVEAAETGTDIYQSSLELLMSYIERSDVQIAYLRYLCQEGYADAGIVSACLSLQHKKLVVIYRPRSGCIRTDIDPMANVDDPATVCVIFNGNPNPRLAHYDGLVVQPRLQEVADHVSSSPPSFATRLRPVDDTAEKVAESADTETVLSSLPPSLHPSITAAAIQHGLLSAARREIDERVIFASAQEDILETAVDAEQAQIQLNDALSLSQVRARSTAVEGRVATVEDAEEEDVDHDEIKRKHSMLTQQISELTKLISELTIEKEEKIKMKESWREQQLQPFNSEKYDEKIKQIDEKIAEITTNLPEIQDEIDEKSLNKRLKELKIKDLTEDETQVPWFLGNAMSEPFHYQTIIGEENSSLADGALPAVKAVASERGSAMTQIDMRTLNPQPVAAGVMNKTMLGMRRSVAKKGQQIEKYLEFPVSPLLCGWSQKDVKGGKLEEIERKGNILILKFTSFPDHVGEVSYSVQPLAYKKDLPEAKNEMNRLNLDIIKLAADIEQLEKNKKAKKEAHTNLEEAHRELHDKKPLAQADNAVHQATCENQIKFLEHDITQITHRILELSNSLKKIEDSLENIQRALSLRESIDASHERKRKANEPTEDENAAKKMRTAEGSAKPVRYHADRFYQKLLNGIHHWDGIKDVVKGSLSDETAKSSAAAMKQRAERFGYRCVDVKREGRCFHDAFIQQLRIINPGLYSIINEDAVLRYIEKVVQHIINNHAVYEAFIRQSHPDIDGLNGFIEKMLENDGSLWVDEIIIRAVSRVFNVNIVIVPNNDNPLVINRRNFAEGTVYLGHEVGTHYQSLERDLTIEAQEDLNPYIERVAFDEWMNERKAEDERRDVVMPSVRTPGDLCFMPPCAAAGAAAQEALPLTLFGARIDTQKYRRDGTTTSDKEFASISGQKRNAGTAELLTDSVSEAPPTKKAKQERVTPTLPASPARFLPPASQATENRQPISWRSAEKAEARESIEAIIVHPLLPLASAAFARAEIDAEQERIQLNYALSLSQMHANCVRVEEGRAAAVEDIEEDDMQYNDADADDADNSSSGSMDLGS